MASKGKPRRDLDEVVDGCGFGAAAPVADVVVLEEFCSGCAVGRVVEVFAPVVSHVATNGSLLPRCR